MRALKATAASITLLCASCVDVDVSRRRALQLHAFSAPVAVPPLIAVAPAHAASRKYSAADASKAFAELKAARAALDAVDKPLAGGDLEKAAAALQAPPLVAFEDNATIIVQAPVLTAEDKKAIGTIRRYAVAADVIIMTGGLSKPAWTTVTCGRQVVPRERRCGRWTRSSASRGAGAYDEQNGRLWRLRRRRPPGSSSHRRRRGSAAARELRRRGRSLMREDDCIRDGVGQIFKAAVSPRSGASSQDAIWGSASSGASVAR